MRHVPDHSRCLVHVQGAVTVFVQCPTLSILTFRSQCYVGGGFLTVEMPVLQLASDKVNPDVWPFSWRRIEKIEVKTNNSM